MNPEHSFRRRAQMDFIPADAGAFKSVAKANQWKVVGPKHKGQPRGRSQWSSTGMRAKEVNSTIDRVIRRKESFAFKSSAVRSHTRSSSSSCARFSTSSTSLRARGPDRPRARRRAFVAVGRDCVDRGEAGMHDRDAAAMGAAGRTRCWPARGPDHGRAAATERTGAREPRAETRE